MHFTMVFATAFLFGAGPARLLRGVFPLVAGLIIIGVGARYDTASALMALLPLTAGMLGGAILGAIARGVGSGLHDRR